MISFNQLLDGLQIRLTPFAVCEIRKGASLPLTDPAVHIHYVLQGEAVVLRRGAPDERLPLHSVMVVPPGLKVRLACGADHLQASPEVQCKPLPGGWDWIDVGEGEPGAVVACAHLQATHQGTIGLFDHLREPIICEMVDQPALHDAMELLVKELAWPKPGTPALASILMKQSLILLLRRYWENDSEPPPWLAALRHPQLGKALGAMTQELRSSYSLERLAEIAGMSRASFASQFRKTFGRPPMEYLKEMRLNRAAELLATTDLPVKIIADRVGFESRSHFTRAFKAFAGLQPLEYRSSTASGDQDTGPAE